MTSKQKTNIAIVGAGASGLFLAKKTAENPHHSVFLFEKLNKVGTKLKASGGGKANIFNRNIVSEAYNAPLFIDRMLGEVNDQTIKKEFEAMGLKMVSDSNGWVYPRSYFSQSVLDVLLEQLTQKVQIVLNYTVAKVQKVGELWKVNDFPILFDKIVFATGTPAGIIEKNRKDCTAYLTDLNLQQKVFQPSLVGFKILHYPKELFGCRAKALVSLFQKERLVFQEYGEVVFKEDGISGIVVLNASSHYNRLDDKKDCSLCLNFLYDDPLYNVEQHFEKYHHLSGIVHPKLSRLYQKQPFDLRHFVLKIEQVYDLTFAQVSSGGVCLSEITNRFELKKYKNAYVIGEMLDVDGICGGYNLFFAFASAFLLAQTMNQSNEDRIL